MPTNICVKYSYKQPKIGDNVILTEFPENLYNAGYTFINKYNNPFLEYNPFVAEGEIDIEINFNDLDQTFIKNSYNINSRSELLFKHLNINATPKIIKPRLYVYENNKKENLILMHLSGKQPLPENVVDYVLTKYSKHYTIIQIKEPKYSWKDIAEMASKSIMFIGSDSWISHLAQAYITNVNVFIEAGFIKYFNNASQPFGYGSIGNIWLHPNNYYFNETDQSYGFTNSYLTL